MVALCVRWTASRMAALCVSSGTRDSKLQATVRLPRSDAPGSGAIHVLLPKVFQNLIEEKKRNTVDHTCPIDGNTNVRTGLDVSETHLVGVLVGWSPPSSSHVSHAPPKAVQAIRPPSSPVRSHGPRDLRASRDNNVSSRDRLWVNAASVFAHRRTPGDEARRRRCVVRVGECVYARH